MQNKYYIYVYLDPRKRGKYKYDDLCFTYEPFYVGYGFGSRCFHHLRGWYLDNDTNKSKVNKIKKLLRLGFDLKLGFIIKIKENLFLEEAKSIEIAIINKIGRKDLNKGTLTNLSDGGEGASGRLVTKEERIRASKRLKGRAVSEKVKKQISKSLLGHHVSDETKRKISIKNLNRGMMSQKTKNKISTSLKGVKRSIETKSKMSLSSIGKQNFLGKHHSDLSKRKISKGNRGKKRTIKQNLQNTLRRQKLTFEQASEIRRLRKNKIPRKEVARAYNVSEKLVYNITSNKTYKINIVKI